MRFTRPQLLETFETNLADLIKDNEVRAHVVGVLDGFVHEKKLPIKEAVTDSVKVNNLFEQGEFYPLVELGDAYMFMCGFFPEYLSKKRRNALGIKFYVEKGRDSYNYALSLSYVEKGKTIASGLVSRLSDSFVSNANAILNLRRKLRGTEVVIDSDVYDELRTVIGYKPDPQNFFVIVGGGSVNPREKYVADGGSIRRVK